MPRWACRSTRSIFPSIGRIALAGMCLALVGCESETVDLEDDTFDNGTVIADGARTFLGEVWADNWSSMYVDGTLVMEDSVSITTERSFNAETFTFDAERPFLIAAVLKDFIETDSGLEYIGEPNQQMGDGGYIAQISDVDTGDRVLVTTADWRCLTIHQAPLNKECESDPNPDETCKSSITDEPEGWQIADFDDAEWGAAIVHSAEDVDPKHGYDDIVWDPSAQFIWGADLESHNTVLCRVWVTE